MRTALALALLLALAPITGAHSLPPPRGQIVPSPDGRFVFVSVAPWWGGVTDPDAAAIREKCKTSGLYRRGEWDAPLWQFEPRSAEPTFYAANDGVHLAARSDFVYCALFSSLATENPFRKVQVRKRFLDLGAFDLYANGKFVRTVPASEVVGNARAAYGPTNPIESAGFGADGLFRVVSKDGNRTVWNPATGERVEGTGAPPELFPEFADAPLVVQAALLVLGAVVLGVCLAAPRVARRRVL